VGQCGSKLFQKVVVLPLFENVRGSHHAQDP
jgi:hypothetical protein